MIDINNCLKNSARGLVGPFRRLNHRIFHLLDSAMKGILGIGKPADTWDAGQNDDVRPAPRTNARVNRARATSKTNTC
jgi:hypothetical protein